MNEEHVNVHDYVDIVYRKKWLIVMIFSCVFLTTLFFVQRQPQNYLSNSTIYLDHSKSGMMMPESMIDLGKGRQMSQARPLQFYLGIFDSRSFRQAVKSRLVSYAEGLGMDTWSAKIHAGTAMRRLQIKRGTHEGYYVISVQAGTPDIAYATDSIATYLFIERCVEIVRGETTSMAFFVEQQFQSARDSLSSAESQINKFRRDHNLIQISSAAQANPGLPIEYVRLVEGYYEAQKHRQSALATLEATVKAASLSQESLDSLGGSSVARARPVQEVADLKEFLRKARIDLQIKQLQERSFLGQLRAYERSHPEISEVTVQYVRLNGERTIYQKLSGLLLERRVELRVQAASESGGLQVIDRPVRGIPIRSNTTVLLTLGAVIGLVFGVGVAFLWETMDPNIKSSADVTKTMGTTSIGTIPRIGLAKKSSSVRGSTSSQNVHLISSGNPRGPIAEAYRALRTSLLYSGDKTLGTIVLTSPGQSEGKSLTTANLGITCAQMGQRVVIIDGDLRRPVQHTLFNLERERGLTEFLLQDMPLDQVVKPSGVDNLDIVTSGVTPPNPAPLLASEALSEGLRRIKQEYDLILIDSPPVIAVTDPVLLGRLSDGVLVVVRCAMTPRTAAKHAYSTLSGAGVSVIGAVLNDVDVSRHYGGYHYYYYYHYYYGYYGYRGADGEDGDTQIAKEGGKTIEGKAV
jgi:capsular exopolysaccharide synthesis family protein